LILPSDLPNEGAQNPMSICPTGFSGYTPASWIRNRNRNIIHRIGNPVTLRSIPVLMGNATRILSGFHHGDIRIGHRKIGWFWL